MGFDCSGSDAVGVSKGVSEVQKIPLTHILAWSTHVFLGACALVFLDEIIEN